MSPQEVNLTHRPAPPVPADVDLGGRWMAFASADWMNASAACKTRIQLWWQAWKQIPAGDREAHTEVLAIARTWAGVFLPDEGIANLLDWIGRKPLAVAVTMEAELDEPARPARRAA